MKFRHKYLIICLTFWSLCSPWQVFAQDKFTLSGVVTETATWETLIGVNISIPEINAGAISNAYGFYSITLPGDSYNVVFSSLGFITQQQSVDLTRSLLLNMEMSEDAEQLAEVVIKADVEALDLKSPQMSVNTLTAQTIKNIPVILGEADVVKSLLLLPGVSNAGEGASGFNVRGGATDQNLILVDEATIFNSSHLFGFFSVFNPDAIKDVKLYKGSIPARYG